MKNTEIIIIFAIFWLLFMSVLCYVAYQIMKPKHNNQEIKHTCGSWPGPGWSEEDYKRKDEAMKNCKACNFQGIYTVGITNNPTEKVIVTDTSKTIKVSGGGGTGVGVTTKKTVIATGWGGSGRVGDSKTIKLSI